MALTSEQRAEAWQKWMERMCALYKVREASVREVWARLYVSSGPDAETPYHARTRLDAGQTFRRVLEVGEKRFSQERAEDNQELGMDPCGKCGGVGFINGFSHVLGGVCFDCNGKGYTPPAPRDESLRTRVPKYSSRSRGGRYGRVASREYMAG